MNIYIYSHELNYIDATTCFMSQGQSSGNWTEIWSVFSCCEKLKQIYFISLKTMPGTPKVANGMM